jgi:hypothetical protein
MRRNRFWVAVAARTLFVSKLIGITRASPPPMSTDFAPRPKRVHQACPVGSHRSGSGTTTGRIGVKPGCPYADPVAVIANLPSSAPWAVPLTISVTAPGGAACGQPLPAGRSRCFCSPGGARYYKAPLGWDYERGSSVSNSHAPRVELQEYVATRLFVPSPGSVLIASKLAVK